MGQGSLRLLAAQLGQASGQGIQFGTLPLRQLTQYALAQAHLPDKTSAAITHGQVQTHGHALTQAQAGIKQIAGKGYQLLATQH
jgi:hypothetical protein